MPDPRDAEISSIAASIRRYLAAHPAATETVAGIARWWLSRQRDDFSIELVQLALDRLEAQGIISRIPVRDGPVMYKVADN